jgi:REP element-mobilizing transposase RayT
MFYHVMSRGNAKQVIFTDDVEYRRYLALLTSAVDRFDVRCAGYCLMRNHVHLLLQPHDVAISRLMQQLNSTYCQWFNRRHDRVGHVLQGRHRAVLVDSNESFLRVLRYIVRNPVASRYVKTPAAWPWSSYRATAGLTEPPPLLDLGHVLRALDAEDQARAQTRFKTFVAVATDDGVTFDQFLLGSDAFLKKCAPALTPHRDCDDFVYAERFAARPPLTELLASAESVLARNRAVRRAFCEYAYTLREIGAHTGRPVATVWSWIQRARRGETRRSPRPVRPKLFDQKIEI